MPKLRVTAIVNVTLSLSDLRGHYEAATLDEAASNLKGWLESGEADIEEILSSDEIEYEVVAIND